MNKHCYRVIFSKTLNCLVVVSELSKTEGKHSGSCSKRAGFVDSVTSCIKPLCFSVFCALGFVSYSFADTLIIKADSSAPKNTQPIVLQTANGIPQVNIQPPNAKGLSHNKYSKFDVDTKGAILNNSRKTTQTKLGGYVQGNPYLARGEAKVILNEVNSTDSSLMKGYVEVAGKKADVIIANPSGITCQGCGVINSNRVTVTTGKPKISDGQVDSFDIEKGTVSVSGKGFDNSQVDYTEILSQKTKINAGIWSNKKLSVVTGQNTIKRSDSDENLQIIHTKAPLGSTTNNQYAVDVGELGGMYSGQIHLVGTEQGLGVKSAGHIGAGVGEVTIDANGKIINSGIINANQQITVTVSDDVQNTGKIEAKHKNIQIKTKGNLKQDGSVIAQKGNVKVTADKNITQQGETVAHKNIDYTAQNVNATTSSIIAAGVEITQTDKGEKRQLENQSEIGKNITVHTTESTTLQGKNIASGKLDIRATRVNLDNSQTSGYDVKVIASENNIEANSATVTAKKDLALTTPTILSTKNSHLKAEKITTKQQNLNTQNATWTQTGKADFNLTAESVKNRGGQISTQGNFDLKTKNLENTKGVLLSGKALDIKASDKLISTEGVISSKEDLTINSGELNNDKGLIQTEKSLKIDTNGKSLSNKETSDKGIVVQGTLNLSTAKIENQQGHIASKDSQQIIATEIDNTQGKIQTENSIEVKAINVTNTQGEISANQEAILTLSNDLLQQKGTIKASELTIHANQVQSENSSQILADNLDIVAKQNLSNNASTILANKDIKLASQQLDNTKGVISSEIQSVDINTHQQGLNNTQGQIRAKTDLTVNSGMLSNNQGTIYGKTVAIDTHNQDLTNTQTKPTKEEKGKGITALETLTLKTKDIKNTAGRIVSGQGLSIAAQNITNAQGQIQTNSNLDITAKNITNNQGKITAKKQAEIKLSGDLTQSKGVIVADIVKLVLDKLSSIKESVITGKTTEITATKTVDNSESEISATNNLTIDSQALNNTKGKLLSENANIKLDTHQQKLNNTQGKISAKTGLTVDSGELDNTQGLLQSQDSLSVNTHKGNLINKNTQTNTTNKSQGIIAQGELTVTTQDLANQQGVIASGKTQQITAENIDNTKGIITGQQGQTLKVQNNINNQSGRISANGVKISSSHFDNTKQGKVLSKSNLALSTVENIDNTTGMVKGNNDVTLETKSINNKQGYIGSVNKNVGIKTQQVFDNTNGGIEAKNNIELSAKGINNQLGKIYTQQGDIDLNAQSQAVNNQQGEVIAGKNLNLNSGNITNTQGKLFANNDNNITAIDSVIDNKKEGKIQAVGHLSVKAKQLDNQGGFVQSGKDSTLTIKDSISNQKVASSGSLIEAGKTLTITTDRLNNQNTIATAAKLEQGIVAENLDLHTPILSNSKGGVYIQKQATLNVTKNLDNQSGEILSWGNIAINGFKTDLTINNEKGKIQAQQALDINAKSLSMNGHLEADNLKLKLKDDVVTEQDINAKASLSIDTQGNIKNSKKLSANDRLTLKANNIENTIDGRISSTETRVTAKDTVTNRGLINSFAENNQSKTVVKGNTIHNLGTGRIYGDNVALEAENILNQDESVNGEDKSATIAARQRLDIAGKEIINNTTIYNPDKKGGSTIYSEGDIIFGRTLNNDNQAEGNAESLRNKSSIIEANGSIGLNVNDINNSNEYYRAELQETSSKDVRKHYILPDDVATGDDPYNNGKLNYINTNELKYVRFSRSGRWVENVDAKEPQIITDISQIKSNTLLAVPNTLECQDVNNPSSCKIIKASIYTKDNPIWTYFNITPPKEEQPEPSSVDIKEYLRKTGVDVDNLSDEQLGKLEKNLKTPVVPPKPIEPLKKANEIEEDFQKRLTQYQEDKIKYDKAIALKNEFEQFKPILNWTNKNGDKLKELSQKILDHNRKIYGMEYYRYWNIYVNKELVKETMTITSLPGKILAGKDISYHSNKFLNDKSVVVAGNKLTQIGQSYLENKDDEDATRQDIELGSRNWSKSRWRGGVRRYHKRYTYSHGSLKRINEIHKDMNIFLTKEHTTPATYKNYINVKQQNNIAKEQNEVKLNDLSQVSTTKVSSTLAHSIGGVYFNAKKYQKLTSEASKIDKNELISVKQQQVEKNTNLSEVGLHKVTLDKNQILQNTDLEIRSMTVDTRLANQGLYIINPKPNSHYVIETDPEFTHHKKWLGSDYMFNALRYEPNYVQKRLGDGFYEQKLVREQINRLTGHQFLGDYSNFESQYKALMDDGVTFAKKFNLTPGISLSEGQVAQLTSDIVWLESQTVTLPNGKVEKVLVPKVYVMARKGDITGNGTLISGNQLNINADEIINQGTVAGRTFAQLNANKLKNSGKLSAGVLHANIKGNVENIGGVMEADNALLLNVTGDLIHRLTTQTTNVDLDGFKRTQTNLDRKALLHVKGKDGKLQINANNINITGADIINDGKGQSYISAKNNLNLTALEIGFNEKMGSGNHYRNEKVQDVEISHIKTQGDMILKANNITSEGAELESQAKLIALAENDLVLNGATRTGDYEEYHYTKYSGVLSKSSKETFDKKQKTLHKGTSVSGNSVILQAGHNIESKASQLNAQNDLSLIAKNQITLDAELDKKTENHWAKKKKSGFGASFSGGVFSVGYSKSKAKQNNTTYDETAKGTSLNSDKGNVTVVAQKELTLNSAKVNAKQDTTLQGSHVNVNEVVEQHNGHSDYYAKSSGIGLSVVVNPVDVFKKEKENQTSQGSTQGVVGKTTATAEALDRTIQQVVSGVSPYLYSKKSSGNKNITQQVAQVSQVSAGKDLTILATEKDIVTKGALLTAEGDSLLQAKGNVLLGVAENTQQQVGNKTAKGFSFDGKQRIDLMFGTYKDREEGQGKQFSQQGTTLSVGGKSTVIAETGDIKAKGSTIVSTKDNLLDAKKNIELDTAISGTHQKTNENDQAIGSVRVSDTEQFSGYNRKLANSNNGQLTHKGNQIASLEGDTTLIAGEKFSQTSSELLAKNKVKVTAKEIEFNESHNQQALTTHNSDLKIGQFSRVKSPIITLIQTAEKAIKNKDASDRVKAANALSLASQGYDLAKSTDSDKAVLFRAESGVGVSHSRNDFKGQQKISQGNIVNAKETQITATEGNLTATNTHFTSKNEKGEKVANSSVNLTASKDILLQAGISSNQQKGKQQSAGIEVGMAVSIGAKTGVSVYGKAGFSKGKQNQDGTTYHNTKIETENLTLTSGENTTLKGATAKADKITANVGKDLNIESLQDTNQSSQKQSGANIKAEFGFGNAWDFSAGANRSKGKSNYKQVNEQSGLIAGDGGYHVNAENIDLKGEAIASTNAENSELTTNKLTFSDIQNESESSAMSASISGTLGKEADTEKKDENGKVQKDENGKAIMIEGADKTAFSPNLPMKSGSSDSSITKATLTEGKITLNKDTNPTQTTAKALGINTDISKANIQTETPKDVDKMLKEQGEIAEITGQIGKVGAKAVGDFSQKMGWEDGSPQKLALHGFLGAITAKAGGGNVLAGMSTGALNEWVGTQLQNYLADNPNLSQAQRKALQQFAATGLGAVVGSMAGGNNTFINSQVSLNAEKFNRQLHPDAIRLIRENAKRYAEKQGISEEQAIQELTAESSRGVSDDFAEVEKNETARAFLNELQKEQDDKTLFAELDRNSDEYKNSFINSDTISKNQDIYNSVVLPNREKGSTVPLLYNMINQEIGTGTTNPTLPEMEQYIKGAGEVIAGYQDRIYQLEQELLNGKGNNTREISTLQNKINAIQGYLSNAAVHSGHYTPLGKDKGSKLLAQDLAVALGGIGSSVTKGLRPSLIKGKSNSSLGKITDYGTPKIKLSVGDDVVKKAIEKSKGIYEPKEQRTNLEIAHGSDNITSTSIPKKPHQASVKRSDVITDTNGNKAVKLTLDDGNVKHIPYDSRGLPIFDDVAVFTTKIDHTKSYQGQMRQASRDMWKAIKDDPVAKSRFTELQLYQLQKGRAKITDFTWHHNAQSAPNSMQLVPKDIHSNSKVPHTGQNSLKGGQ